MVYSFVSVRHLLVATAMPRTPHVEYNDPMVYDVPHGRRRAVLRVLWLFVFVELVGVATGLAIAVQAGRSDSSPAHAALVLLQGNDGDQLRLNHAQELWRDGNIRRIVVGGRDVDAAGAYLVQRGVQPVALVTLQGSSEVVLLADTHRALTEAQQSSVLLITEPSQTLRVLKIARDLGLQPGGLPTGTSTRVPVKELALEVGRYFRYVLVGQ
jgi:uncharacterized SAM-binding protein YcdF (DUF218 family)